MQHMRWWYGLLAVVAMVCGIGYALFPDAILSFDSRILAFFREAHSLFSVTLFGIITSIGSWYGVLLVLVSLGVYARGRQLNFFYYYVLVGLVGVSGGMVYVVKNLVERARPSLMPAFFVETSFSFPSGHAAVAVVLYGFLWYWFAREKILIHSLRVTFFSLLVLIPFSRIFLGVHYVSDVVAGMLLGALLLGFCLFFVDKRRVV